MNFLTILERLGVKRPSRRLFFGAEAPAGNRASRVMKYSFVVLFFLALLVGCGKNVPLSGTVKDNEGNLITVGTVNFSSSKEGLSRAKIKSDGTYIMGTLKETDGLPPGTYKVYVSGAEVPIERKGAVQRDSMGQPVETMSGYRQLVDRKFMTEATTPLTCEVPTKNNQYDIVVDKPK